MKKNIYAYNDKNNYIKNMETIPTNKDFKKNLTENELIKRMFPNEESLKVKESDNEVIANIKNQVYEIKLYDDLRKKYNFYNVKRKSCNKKISKIKIKNIVNLFNDGYKQNSGSLHRKLYFKHINRQKKNVTKEIIIPIAKRRIKDVLKMLFASFKSFWPIFIVALGEPPKPIKFPNAWIISVIGKTIPKAAKAFIPSSIWETYILSTMLYKNVIN